MPLLPTLASLFRTLFRSARLDRDLDDELRAFAEAREAHHIARGLSHAAARRAALIEMGGIERVKEQVRDRRVGWSIETLWRDVRYGGRLIVRAPAFAVVVVLTLALVIGANATVFSVMHAVLWRELPYPDARRLVVVDADTRAMRGAGLADDERADLRAESGVFDRLASVSRVDAHVTIDDEMEQVPAASATGEALGLLGAWPLLHGRLLDVSRDVGSDGLVRGVVVSHDLWQRRLAGDPRAVGRRIEVNNLPVEVIGVLRPDFRVFLPANTALPEDAGVWFPRPLENDRRSRAPGTIARLAPGASLAVAQARLDVIAPRFVRDHPAAYPDGYLRLSVVPLRTALTAEARPAMWALTIAVAFVLLVGCVNVGNLMLARARVRMPEMAVRRALGAGRVRLVRQLFTETAMLAVAGGIAGLLVACAGVALVEWMRPLHLPRQSQIAVNETVALFTAALAIVVSLLFGLLPALATAGGSAREARGTGRAGVQRSGLRGLQRGLVVAEVALCIIPLVAAGLMLHTFVNLTNAPLGFDPDGLQTAKVPFSLRLFPERQQRLQLLTSAVEEVRTLPGVRAVSAGGPLPFDHQFLQPYGRPDGIMPLTSRATVQSVLPGYLDITRVQLEAGRDFTMNELIAQRRVAIVDQRIARQLWPDGAIGRRIAVGEGSRPRVFEVIGVTRPVRALRVRDAAIPHLFVPYDHFGLVMALVVDTDEPAAAVGPALKRAVEALGTRRPVHDILPMRTYVERSMGDTRFTMLVIGAFGASGLLLAGVGIYGTLAYLTAQRSQEFGVRMALGASGGRVVRGVVGEVLVLTAAGAALGLAGAMVAGVLLQDLLYGVTPFDSRTLLTVVGLVAVVALAATAQPAARAARTNPANTLRAE